MGSTMTVMPSKHNSSGLFGSTKPTPVWLQFVPGIVMDVVINSQCPAYSSERDINSIIAKSHILPKSGLKLKNIQKKRYYPLFRGITDTPIKGDQVLLCTFGGVNYYMGPVNTVNSPNWNVDHLNVKAGSELGGIAPAVKAAKGLTSGAKLPGSLNKYGLASTFKTHKEIKRMQKHFNKSLDDSLELTPEDLIETPETHGDMVLEGRHGNSFRIGSRDMNPYMLFSNGRELGNESESNMDGSILLISDFGTIHQHFPNDIIFPEEDSEEPELLLFNLASDTVGKDKENGQKRLIGSKDVEDSESKGLYNYEYKEPQVFLNSDRITFNSKKDSMFLSAYQDVVIGAGNTLNIISENETIIESSNIYLGRQSKLKKDGDGDTPAEPLVLGEQLRLFLVEFIEVIEKAHGLCQGAPIPIMDSSGAPLLPQLQQLKDKINSVSTAPFNSEYHFIEDNGNKPE